ncbi:short chain dehydrogenase [Stagonosporopsis vannaccii]|nr:short chain dehydrogenase [Stagonosporopsis vannaccii]
MQSIILITGANSGIGFELASQLLTDSTKLVLLGCRSAEKGLTAVRSLQARNLPGTVAFLHVDVTSEISVANAAKDVEAKYGRLDALVNNAAIGVPPGSFAQQMARSFQTNTIGPAIMVEAFAPLLKKSIATPRIVNVSSEVGSIGNRLDPNSPHFSQKNDYYRVSKAALNMVTACQAVEYGDQGWKIFAYCPGFTVSSISEYNKEEFGAQPTNLAAKPMVDLLEGKRDAEHGLFVHSEGLYVW